MKNSVEEHGRHPSTCLLQIIHLQIQVPVQACGGRRLGHDLCLHASIEHFPNLIQLYDKPQEALKVQPLQYVCSVSLPWGVVFEFIIIPVSLAFNRNTWIQITADVWLVYSITSGWQSSLSMLVLGKFNKRLIARLIDVTFSLYCLNADKFVIGNQVVRSTITQSLFKCAAKWNWLLYTIDKSGKNIYKT